MKKAKVILSLIALFAVVGAAFAFKAHRTSIIALSYTSEYTVGTVTYKAPAGFSYCVLNTLRYVTTIPGATTTVYTAPFGRISTATVPFTTTTTLGGPTVTTTLPVYNCSPLLTTSTLVTAIQ